MNLGLTVDKVELESTVSNIDLGPSFSYLDAGISSEYQLGGLECSCIDMRGEIMWVDAQPTNVYLDVSGFLSSLRGDTFSITDAAALSVSTAYSDSFSLSDTPPDIQSDKGLSTPVTLSDVIAFLITFIRNITDTVNLTESLAKDMSRSLNDGISIMDSIQVTRGFDFLVNDNVSIGQAVSVAVDKPSTADSTSVSDSSSFSVSKPLGETVSISESIQISGGTFFLETLTLSDSIVVDVTQEATAVVNGGAINTFAING